MLYKDYGWLYEQYVTKQRTLKDIADELGVRVSTIHSWRVKLGIEKVIRPSDNNTYVPVQCKHCKEDFQTNIRYIWRRYREENRTYFYCSNKCQTNSLVGKKMPNHGLKGPDNPSWKGGVSPINENLRYALKDWKKQTLRNSEYTCYITGEKGKGDLHVHHVTPFHKIRDKAIEELNLFGKKELKDFKDEEFDELKSKIIELHEDEKGFVLKDYIHILFHRVYGDNTTEDDLINFKIDYLEGKYKFNDVS